LTDVGGFGLQHSSAARRPAVGIRKRHRHQEVNPAADPDIPAPHSPPTTCPGKSCASRRSRKRWGLPAARRRAVFGMSARLVAQKGLDQIVASAIVRLLDAQFIFLGAGEAQFGTRCASSRPVSPPGSA